jgi:hypothetical protein
MPHGTVPGTQELGKGRAPRAPHPLRYVLWYEREAVRHFYVILNSA